jgi:uncharacterized protein
VTNLDVVRELYRAFRARDTEAFRAVCAPELEWVQNPGFPGGATWNGADAVLEGVLLGNDRRWAEWRFEIDGFVDAGASGVLVTGRYLGRARATSRPVVSEAAHLYELRNGRVVRFRQFADTKPLWDALEENQ